MFYLTDEQKKHVRHLLEQMTLEEKLGQMNLASITVVGGITLSLEEIMTMYTEGRISAEEIHKMFANATKDYREADIRAGKLGNMMYSSPEKSNELQKVAVEESRLGIPLLFGNDVIHGFRSVYPIGIAEAGTFDVELFEKTAAMAARESRAAGINWHFAPMIDVARDARWGRVSEGPGEDPYLASQFARAKVRGLQGGDSKVAACLKHYVAYGACEGGEDYATTSMAPSLLYNVYLPPYRAAVDEGAVSVMSSFNDLNGVPCTANEFTLRKILKGEMDFQGFVVSDAGSIRECVTHGIAEDDKDAGIKAANAGLDMDMGTEIFLKHLTEAVQDGKVPMAVIDEAVERILAVKTWLGLFEQPYIPEAAMHSYDVIPAEHINLALEAAQKAIVLLKNENQVLPLKKGTKVSLVGELASLKKEVVGAWALSWQEGDCVSILDGLTNAGGNFTYHACCGPTGDINQEEVQAAIGDGDVIVAVVGETSNMSGEAASRADITLPGKQRALLEMLVASGKPVIAILMNGRPLALSWEKEHLPAIIEGWQLGIQMGNAIASVLYGDYNPSGKLSASFPNLPGQCPVYYNHFNTGRPGSKVPFTSKYSDAGWKAAYPFGYGLSYTTFEQRDFVLREEAEQLVGTVTIQNTGERAGTETVQLYMRDVTASLVRPVKELKGFQKVHLQPGESAEVSIGLLKKDMGFYDNEGVYRLESGKFQVFMGGDSENCLMQEIVLNF